MKSIIIIPLAVLAGISVLLFETGAILAVYNDSKGRGAKNNILWTVLTLLSPFIVGLIYYFSKDSLASGAPRMCTGCGTIYENEKFICPNCGGTQSVFCEVTDKPMYLKKAKKWAKVSVISLVIYVVLLVSVCLLSAFLPDSQYDESEPSDAIHYAYNVDGVETYYDLKGNSYTDPNAVLYYDEMGNAYQYDRYTHKFICNGEEYFSFDAFVDKNGYFVYNDRAVLSYDSDSDTGNWVDENNNKYFNYFFASWDADGNLVDSFTGDPLFD